MLKASKIGMVGVTAPDINQIVQRSRQFGAILKSGGHAAIVLIPEDNQVSTYIVTEEGRAGDNVLNGILNAVGARAVSGASEHCLAIIQEAISSSESVGALRAVPQNGPSKSIQQNANPVELAQIAHSMMEPGTWVCLSMRAATNSEMRRTRKWYHINDPGVRNHHTSELNQATFSLIAGGRHPHEVENMLLSIAGSMPGFDVDTRADILAVAHTDAIISFVIGAGLSAAFFFTKIGWPLLMLAGLSFVLGFLFYRGIVKTHRTRMIEGLMRGEIPLPPKRIVPPSAPRQEKQLPDGKIAQARVGSWPLADYSFMASPTIFIGLASRHVSTSSENAAAASRAIPSVLLSEDIGPIVGIDDRENYVRCSASDIWSGVGMFGIPGSGKTELMRSLFGWSVLERVSPSRRPGWPGPQNALFVFEVKGEASGWEQWISDYGDRSITCDLFDVNTPAIDLYQFGTTPEERGSSLAYILSRTFPDSAIQGRSMDVMVILLTAALSFPLPEIWSGMEGDYNPLNAAYILCGGYGDEPAQNLYQAMVNYQTLNPDENRQRIVARMAAYFISMTPSARRNEFNAARNKFSKLSQTLGAWFLSSRPRFTWARALRENWIVIFNYGATGGTTDEEAKKGICAALLYALEVSIQQTCGGWEKEGRRVSIFIDELSVMADVLDEVINWFRNQGRSFGVCPFLAAQMPEQLPREVRTTVAGLGLFFWFRQSAADIISEAARDLANYGNWTSQEVASLPNYHALMRSSVGGQAQPAVFLKIPYWGEQPDIYAVENGYEINAQL
ncbi:hypothetical protein [Ferrimicrobium acidiphilum]|jgi:hypothetical protein|uniref:hypothetical protein n=1 Tax=Ferrimicrobium acidiphilum TaxID=121039 RepID=UPI0023F36C18|nr:hypothetical protein [Ferrimicrobium acidiphilum]